MYIIKFMLNDLDRRILRHLQLDPGRSVAALAEAANTTSAVRRWQRLPIPPLRSAPGVLRV